MAGGFSGSPSPSDGNTASQALVVPELDDFDREGERWVWTYATTDIEKLQVVISTGRDPATGSWIITGASNCGERRA